VEFLKGFEVLEEILPFCRRRGRRGLRGFDGKDVLTFRTSDLV
jgi:hypothetical protein